MEGKTTGRKKISGRILSVLLTLAMLVGMMPGFTFPAAANGIAEAPEYAESPAAEEPGPAESTASDVAETAGPSVWDEIDAMEAEHLEAGTGHTEPAGTEGFYEELIPEVEKLVRARKDYIPGTLLLDKGILFWRMTDGKTYGYAPSCRASRSDRSADPTDTGAARENRTVLKDLAGDNNANTGGAGKGVGSYRDTACFFPYFDIDLKFGNRLDFLWKAQEIALKTGGNYEFYYGTEVTIDRLAAALQNCCVVLWDGHGVPEYSALNLTTDEGITLDDWKEDFSRTYGNAYHTFYCGDDEIAVDGYTIAKHMTGPACNGMLIASSCGSMQGRQLEGPLHDAGVEVVMGFSREVTMTAGTWFVQEFCDGLIKGYTVAQATQYMREQMADRTDLDILNGCTVVYWDWKALKTKGETSSAWSEQSAREKDKAFVVTTSSTDPYPDGAYGTQCKTVVTSTWKLPEPEGAGTEDIEIVAPVGTEFKKYFGSAWSEKKEGVAVLLSPEKIPATVTNGVTKYEKGSDSRMYYSFIVGEFTFPGCWETDVELTNSAGQREIRTLRMMAYETEPSRAVEQSAELEIGDRVIITLDLQSAKIFSFEPLDGELPKGAYLFEYDHGVAVYGYAEETGVYTSSWRVTYWNGKTEDLSLTVTVYGEPEYYNQNVTARTNEAVYLELETGDDSGVFSMDVIEGEMPSGIQAYHSASVPAQINGASSAAGEYTVKLRIVTNKGKVVVHTVSFNIYESSDELRYLRLDLTGNYAYLTAEQYERVWTCLLYASLSGQISADKMSFDLDRDGHNDVMLDRNRKMVALLNNNSLEGDFFLLEMNAATRKKLADAGKTDWYETLNFWLIEYYLLSIDGTPITSRNRSDVLGNGVFSFDGLNVITVHGEYSGTTKEPLIDNVFYPELTVRVQTNSKLTAKNTGIRSVGQLTVTGPGKLRLETGNSGIICGEEGYGRSHLIISDADLRIDAGAKALYSRTEDESALTISSSDLTLMSDDGVSVGFGSLTLLKTIIEAPANYTVEGGELYSSGSTLVKNATFTGCEKCWDLWINKVRVNNRNLGDVLGNGKFSFDGKDTLYINGSATTYYNSVVCEMPQLNIVFAPNTTLTSNGMSVLDLRGCEATITGGPAKLVETHNFRSAAIRLDYNDTRASRLFIADMELDIESRFWGIYGEDYDGITHEVILTNSNVNITAAESCFRVAGDVIISDCDRVGFTMNETKSGVCEFMNTDGSGPATSAQLVAWDIPADYRLEADTAEHTFSFTYGETPEPLTVRYTSAGRSAVTGINELVNAEGLKNQGWTVKKIDGMTFSIAPDPEALILNGIQDDEFVFAVGSIAEGAEFDAPEIRIRADISYPAAKTLTVEDVTVSLWDAANKIWVEQAGETVSVRPGERIRLSYIEDVTRPADEWIVFDESGRFDARRSDYLAYSDDEAFYLVMPASDLTVKAGSAERIGEVALTDVRYPNTGDLAGAFRSVGIPDGAPFTFVRFEWIDDETGETLSDGTPFAYGRGYTGYIYLKPGRGYYFDRIDLPEDVTINGSGSPVHQYGCRVESSGLYRLETGRRVTDPGTVYSVSFTVPIPGDGANALLYPKFISADGDPAIYATTRWLEYDGSSYSDFTGTFREGDTLYLNLRFRCTDPDRHFYTDGSHWLATNVYINGVRRDVKIYGDNIYLDWEITIGPAEGSLGLSETSLDYLNVEEPDNSYTHIEAYLSVSDPSYAPGLIWRSSDTDIATVEAEDGYTAKVTAVGYGDAKITVMTADGLYTAAVPVHNRRPAVRGIELDRHSATVFYPTNRHVILNATVYPENAGNKRVVWRSDDDAVAGVTQRGEVIPRNKGICFITATTEDGDYEATCEIVVRDPVEYDLWIDQIRVTEENMDDILYLRLFEFDGDRTLTVNGSYTARNSSVGMIVSSIPGLIINVTADVTLTDRNGVLRLSGDTTIRGGSLTLKSDTVSPIYVMEGSALTLSGTELNVTGPGGLMGDCEGESLNINYSTVNVSAKVPGWAIYDFNGGVTLKDVLIRIPDNGQFINGTVYDGNGADVSRVTIGPAVPVSGVTLDLSEITLTEGGSAALTAQVEPLDATDKSCTWSTSDQSVVTVDGGGVVTAVGRGAAYVIVRTADGHYIASCLVTVLCAHTSRTYTAERPASCTEEGWDAYSACDSCGQLFDAAGNEIDGIPYRDVIPHTGGTPVRENEIGAGCETEGSYDEVVYCTACGIELSRENKSVPALGHVWGTPEWTWVETADGYTASVKLTCANDAAHIRTVDAEVTKEEDDSKTVYTATAIFEGKTYTDTKEISKTFENPFTDVPDGKWYTKAVLWCYYNGYMTGTSSTAFSPDSSFTRAMFVTVLAKIDGADTSSYTGSSFTDVPRGKWYSKPIQWAFENGYASGLGGGKFGPNASVTREQLAQFLYNYTQKKGKPIADLADISGYSDAGSISGWAKNAVKWAVGNGLISGTSATTLNPKGTATRAQVALIIKNYVEKFVK